MRFVFNKQLLKCSLNKYSRKSRCKSRPVWSRSTYFFPHRQDIKELKEELNEERSKRTVLQVSENGRGSWLVPLLINGLSSPGGSEQFENEAIAPSS